MHQTISSICEDTPGSVWQAKAKMLWPAYQTWWQKDGERARPTYLACRKAIRQHMPELEPTWKKLCDLLGDSDVQARFLSMWCPPPYITGCTQAIWLGNNPDEARLFRNYDFSPALFEGIWLSSRWLDQRVLSMNDCLWGSLDGMNESGLAASLSFGGRMTHGAGFGIPLVMRYVLEICRNVNEAVAVLKRLPHHMSYTISLLDKAGHWATVFVAPDRPTEIVQRRSVSNIQHQIDWPEHERATRAQLRADTLNQALTEAADSKALLSRMLQAPLRQDAYSRGYGTLYTASYAPASGEVQLHWPECAPWIQNLAHPNDERREISLPENLATTALTNGESSGVTAAPHRWMLNTPTSFY